MFTGGHMTPALAVLEELKKTNEYNFVWVGQKYNQVGATDTSPEYKTLKSLGIKFIDLRSGKLVRSWNKSLSDFLLALLNLIRIPWGFIKAFFILTLERPQIIATFGGYIAVPIAFWGRIFGAKVLLHEQTVVTGVSNKYLGRLAHKICISWQSSAQFYPAAKTIFTGNPIRSSVFNKEPAPKFNNNLPVIYITGGNQGSFVLNKAVFDCLPNLLEFTNVIHQSGEVAETIELFKNISDFKDKPGQYLRQAYFYQEQGAIMNLADLIVSRSGANTVTELLALAKMSVLVPIPWVTHNEQFLNAKVLEKVGLGRILPQKELSSDTLFKEIKAGLEHKLNNQNWRAESLKESVEKAKNEVRTDAAQLIAEEIAKI